MAEIFASSVSQVNADWLRATAKDAKLTMTQALDAILDECRARKWTLREQPAQVVQP
jgi:hypothetical protein